MARPGKPLTPDERALWRMLEDMDGVDSLLDFVPLITPVYQRPYHLRPLAEAFQRADAGKEVFLVSSTPPRHAKTESILHFIARHISRHPDQTVAYVTYGASLAASKSRKCRAIAERAGVRTTGHAAEWRTKHGGGLLATGIGGPLTGQGIHMLIVDDPVKNREEAESERVREGIHEWYTSTALSRFEPRCAPKVIVNMARWHDDDLVGRLTQDSEIKYEVMNLQALDDTGGPLWPERWTIDALEQRRLMVGEYDWASLYQGMPMPRDGYVFKAPTHYRLLDVLGDMRVAIGCDPAATSDTSSDHSAIVVVGAKGSGADQKVYVLDVWRGQVEIPALVEKLWEYQQKWQAPAFVEAVAGFKAVPQMLRQIAAHRLPSSTPAAHALRQRLVVHDVHPTADKFTRSLPAKAAWNSGGILVPEESAHPWVREFVREVCKFTGKGDKHDDQVDALAHAFGAVDLRVPAKPRGVRALQGGVA